MEEPDRPQSPFAGMADFSARTPLRCCCPTRSSGCWPSIDFTLRRNITKATARISHQPNLAGRDFSGLNLRGIKMDRAVLEGLISPELISKPRTSSRHCRAGVLRPVRIYRGRA